MFSGTTLYLPVGAGALDSETRAAWVTSVGTESASSRWSDLPRHHRPLRSPLLETAEEWMAIASSPTDDAVRAAVATWCA
jgi:hypothetical protein